jgi:hypothetical protein
MNEATARAPWHLWAVGILTLLWNAIGVMSYMMTHLGKLESLGMTPDQIAYFDSFPAWANAVWAIGVWFCLLGSILLLLRSRYAVTAFAISVIGLVGTAYFSYVVSDVPEELQSVPLDLAIWVITLGSLWYAIRQRAVGVLR